MRSDRPRPARAATKLAIAFLLGSLALQAAPPEERGSVSDPDTFLHLKLPKAQGLEFYKAWTQANADLESGRLAEARRGFDTVLSLLDGMAAKPAERERALFTKAQVYARVLGDRVSARRELTRVLALNPKSADALRLGLQLDSADGKPGLSAEIAAPPVELVPRKGLRKEGPR